MAQRRMFSKTIVEMDSFLDLPVSSRELYFQLGMYADDDGFVSPKKVIRTVGASEDDLKVLIAKQFVIPFESGVIVIRHWKQNNYIQSDRYSPTLHQLEYKQACEDNVYKLDTKSIQDGKNMEHRVGKGRLDKVISKFSYKGNEARKNFGAWEILEAGRGWVKFTGKESEIIGL